MCRIVVSKSVKNHLWNSHKIKIIPDDLPLLMVKDVESLVETITQFKSNGAVEPVEGLPIFAGFNCEKCMGYISTSKKHAKRHLHVCHPSMVFEAVFTTVSIQRFSLAPVLNGCFIVYDEVTPLVPSEIDVAAAYEDVRNKPLHLIP